MGNNFRYHANALSQDVSYPLGCIGGRGNIAVVKDKIKETGICDPGIVAAADQLAQYFEEIIAGLGETALRLAMRQELEADILDDAEAKVLARAEACVKTTIDKRAAARLAKLIGDSARTWT